MPKTRYYILFRNYEEGLALHALLDEHGLENRIVPTPRCGYGRKLACGMSLLIEEEWLSRVKQCLSEEGAEYMDLISVEGQIDPKRDRYC